MALTCNLEGGVSAPDAAVLVARHAVVHPGVDVDPGVQEEEASVGQLHRGMFIVRCSQRPMTTLSIINAVGFT